MMTPNELRVLADRLRDQIQDFEKIGYLALHMVLNVDNLENDIHRIKEWMKDGVDGLQKAADIIELNITR